MSLSIRRNQSRYLDTAKKLILVFASVFIIAFGPASGDMVNADFISSATTNFILPLHAILSASEDSILVSDQFEDLADFRGDELCVAH